MLVVTHGCSGGAEIVTHVRNAIESSRRPDLRRKKRRQKKKERREREAKKVEDERRRLKKLKKQHILSLVDAVRDTSGASSISLLILHYLQLFFSSHRIFK